MRRNAMFAAVLLAVCFHTRAGQVDNASWQGVLRDAAGHPVSGASVVLQRGSEARSGATDAEGKFHFSGLAAGSYTITVRPKDQDRKFSAALDIQPGEHAE